MRTPVVAAVIALVVGPVCFSQSNSWEEDHLRGKVKSITLERAEIAWKGGASLEGKRKSLGSAVYTADGLKTEENHCSSSGASLWTFFFSYDQNGRKRSTECKLANGSTSLKLVYNYDSNGRTSDSATFGPDGKLQEKSFYTNDSHGNNIEIAQFTADGTSIGKWVYTYDGNGRSQDWTVYDSEGTIVEASTYTYDSLGRLKVLAQYGPNNELEKRVTYDSRGNEIQVEKHAPDGMLQWKREFEYEFDDAGNWTKKVTKESVGKPEDVPVEVEYRTIQYY